MSKYIMIHIISAQIWSCSIFDDVGLEVWQHTDYKPDFIDVAKASNGDCARYDFKLLNLGNSPFNMYSVLSNGLRHFHICMWHLSICPGKWWYGGAGAQVPQPPYVWGILCQPLNHLPSEDNHSQCSPSAVVLCYIDWIFPCLIWYQWTRQTHT